MDPSVSTGSVSGWEVWKGGVTPSPLLLSSPWMNQPRSNSEEGAFLHIPRTAGISREGLNQNVFGSVKGWFLPSLNTEMLRKAEGSRSVPCTTAQGCCLVPVLQVSLGLSTAWEWIQEGET